MNKISVIIPIKEEINLGFHRRIIESYSRFTNCELLWVAGPNKDGTYQDLVELEQRVIQTTSNSRAERINIGIEATQHSIILLNHPRSMLSANAINHLSLFNFNDNKIWGGFTHEFYKSSHPVLKFTSFYSNKIRFDLSGIIYLDHCIFLTRNMICPNDSEPVPVVDIFEDTLLSKKLLKQSHPMRIQEKSSTSPVRFTTNGVFKQSMMNQKLKLQHKFGYSEEKMNQAYEKNLNLNSEY